MTGRGGGQGCDGSVGGGGGVEGREGSVGSNCLHQTHRGLGCQVLIVGDRAGDVPQGHRGQTGWGRGQLRHEVGQVLLGIEHFRSHLVLRFPVSCQLRFDYSVDGVSPAQYVGRVDGGVIPHVAPLLLAGGSLGLELLHRRGSLSPLRRSRPFRGARGFMHFHLVLPEWVGVIVTIEWLRG